MNFQPQDRVLAFMVPRWGQKAHKWLPATITGMTTSGRFYRVLIDGLDEERIYDERGLRKL